MKLARLLLLIDDKSPNQCKCDVSLFLHKSIHIIPLEIGLESKAVKTISLLFYPVKFLQYFNTSILMCMDDTNLLLWFFFYFIALILFSCSFPSFLCVV